MTDIQTAPGHPRHLRILAIIGLVFGALTIFSAGIVLFGPQAARTAAGDIVPFVVWFNLVAGVLYIVAALGIWGARAWALSLSALIAITTALVGLFFAWHVLQGGAFEMRTVGALLLRAGLWAVIAISLWRSIR